MGFFLFWCVWRTIGGQWAFFLFWCVWRTMGGQWAFFSSGVFGFQRQFLA